MVGYGRDPSAPPEDDPTDLRDEEDIDLEVDKIDCVNLKGCGFRQNFFP
jgi:hypothetical protein